MKKLLLILNLFLCKQTFGDTFQRIEIVGANKNGSKIAVIKSHFGPSSFTPFVFLNIFEANNQRPLLEKGMSAFQGDEAVVAEMKSKLLSENTSALEEFEISKFFDLTSMNAFATDLGNQFLVEADMFQSGNIARYNFFVTESQSRCEGGQLSHPMALRICSLYEDTPSKCSLIEPYPEPNSLGCFASKIQFSRLLKIGEYLWFHLFFQTEPIEGLFYSSQVLHGEKAP